MAKILIAGCGKLGLKVASALAQQGHLVTGLKRQPPDITLPNLTFYPADLSVPAQLATLAGDFDLVFFILAPAGRDAASYQAVYATGLNNLLAHFAQQKQQPAWFFVSSTSVYGQTQGEWVDEASATKPSSITSQIILAAEQHLLSVNQQHCSVRFAGIYGPGREYLLRLARQAPAIQQDPPYFTNRIHEQDCVKVLCFLAAHRLAGKTLAQCYIASDQHPASQWEVMSWLAEQLNSPPPTPLPSNPTAEQNKRCDNQRLLALGYEFIYPSYREGYLELLSLQS